MKNWPKVWLSLLLYFVISVIKFPFWAFLLSKIDDFHVWKTIEKKIDKEN